MERSEIAIIIPSWNEAKTIGKVVRDVLDIATPIVVNDCSKDATAFEAEAAGAVVVSHKVNKGYDGALNTGFAKAVESGFKYAITFDADGQHDSKLLKEYISRFESGMDLILGVRPRPARFAEHLFAFYTNLRFGIKDPLCGMKGYRLSIYTARGWFDSYGSIGTELALWAIRRGYKTCQIPVPISLREDAPRFGMSAKANWKIIKAIAKSFVR